MKNLSIAIIGSKNKANEMAHVLRNQFQIDAHKFVFGQQLAKQIEQEKIDIVLLCASRRTIANGCKTLSFLPELVATNRIILLSETKDVDLMYAAMENGLRHFILESSSISDMASELQRIFNMMIEAPPKQRILAIGAHPDDVEIGCGGTLKKHKIRGDETFILTLTGGAHGGAAVTQRKNESIAAAKSLKAKLLIGDLRDTELTSGPETISLIEQTIKEFRPDIIYTHSLQDTHQDHRATHYATLVAGRGINKIFAYLAPSGTIDFHPRYFEHIEDYMEDKMEAINCFESQTIGCGRPYLTDSIIRSTAEYWGRFSSYGMVEPFEVIRA